MTGVHAIPGAVTPGGARLMDAMSPGGAVLGEAGNVIRELMETERKYVQELEVLQVRSLLFNPSTKRLSRESSRRSFRVSLLSRRTRGLSSD